MESATQHDITFELEKETPEYETLLGLCLMHQVQAFEIMHGEINDLRITFLCFEHKGEVILYQSGWEAVNAHLYFWIGAITRDEKETVFDAATDLALSCLPTFVLCQRSAEAETDTKKG
ncbi:hypothetical protein UFOVP814_35 [uncultured Caudovirales phage]|uniref:Uncharacterized protein n=1 Tax=uncultured Caudovirales phage TaxID=2100421 RepID=A0A6J5NXK9_9CAUD|nr:hypothetical protein UFOVP814_35 [uncultured Caudovirales phage]